MEELMEAIESVVFAHSISTYEDYADTMLNPVEDLIDAYDRYKSEQDL